ncbi:MAG: hypothetical protein QGI45_01930, partial [Myxococcota bacterium]|nr:hypothetical protein [Myxococcota bacterium]
MGCAAATASETKVLPRLQTLRPQEANARTLEQLDINGDQKLSHADVDVLSELNVAAQAEADKRGLNCTASGALYEGPKDGTPVFNKIQRDAHGYALTNLNDEEVRELTIESRWLALQARQAVGGALKPEAKSFGGSLGQKLPLEEADDLTPIAFCAALDAFNPKAIVGPGFVPTAVFDLDSTIWLGNVTDRFLAKLVEMKMPQAASNPALIEFLKTQPNIDATAVQTNTALQNAQIILRRAADKTLPKPQQLSPKDVFFNIIAMLKGLEVEKVRQVAKEVYESGLKAAPAWRHRVFSDESGCGMRQIVNMLQAKGVQVHVLSATLDVLALEGAQMLGISEDFVQGSRLGMKDGLYTGKLAEGTYYIKGEVVRQW